jgi:DNA primase large subunit
MQFFRGTAQLNVSRVFDYAHKQEIKKVKEDGTWGAAQLETIVHPNEYFKRSYLLKNLAMAKEAAGGEEEKGDIKMEG